MKQKIWMYCRYDGTLNFFQDKNSNLSNEMDWLEIELDINIPDKLFKRPPIQLQLNIEEEEVKKEYTPTLKSSSFGASELRARLTDENATKS